VTREQARLAVGPIAGLRTPGGWVTRRNGKADQMGYTGELGRRKKKKRVEGVGRLGAFGSKQLRE
jgi:hypothetical protein